MKNLKRVISVLLVLLMLMSLSACERSYWKDPNAIEEQAPAEAVKEKRPSGALKFAWTNPIEIHTLSTDTKPQPSYPQLDGFVDEELEAKINALIADLVQKDSGGNSELVYSTEFSCNDILSIVCFEEDAEAGESETTEADAVADASLEAPRFCAVINLRDGEQMSLDELFADGFNYGVRINLAINSKMENAGLEKSFKGVADTTEFYLSNDGLYIIDDGCRWLIGFDAFGKSWAIADGCKGSLYEEPSLSNGVILAQNNFEWIETEDGFTGDLENLWVYEHVRYPDTATDAMILGIEEICSSLKGDKDELVAKAKKSKGSWIVWSTDVSCVKMGDYSVVHGEFSTNSREGYWELEYYNHVYNGNGDELSLDDIFGDSFDYMSFLSEKLDYMMDDIYADYELPEDFNREELLSDLSFRIGYDALYVDTKSVLLTSTREDGSLNQTFQPITLTVSYSELSTSQLDIFGKNN